MADAGAARLCRNSVFSACRLAGSVLATFVPRLAWSREYLAMLLGIFGTTISPYLFFWQASQEVEEERAGGRNLQQRKGATDDELRRLRVDVMTGMFASNLIMYFIVLTTAELHAHGKTDIQTAREAAEALKPLAGEAAYWLFTLGLIGTGMLGVPVLAGSSAYALAEAGAWKDRSKGSRARPRNSMLSLRSRSSSAVHSITRDWTPSRCCSGLP